LISLCKECHYYITHSKKYPNKKKLFEKYLIRVQDKTHRKGKLVPLRNRGFNIIMEREKEYPEIWNVFPLNSKEVEIMRILKNHSGLKYTNLKDYSNLIDTSNIYHFMVNLESMKLIEE
jgi:hypothetical protein